MPNHLGSLIPRRAPDPRLWVVTCYFNPCGYANRRQNYTTFAASLRKQQVRLLTIELCAEPGAAHLDGAACDKYVRVVCPDVLWAKERLLNAAIAELPAECTMVVWSDCDLVFHRADWARATVEALQRHKVVQPFANSVFLAADESPATHKRYGPMCSFGRYYREREPAATLMGTDEILERSHPGYAWAARRSVLAQIGGLYDKCVLGNADLVMALAFTFDPDRDGEVDVAAGAEPGWDPYWGPALWRSVRRWQRQAAEVVRGDLGFVHGTVFHLWHGPVKSRQYATRGKLLADFDPNRHLTADPHSGMWQWTTTARALGLPDRCTAYFASRQEDSQRSR